MVVDPKLQSELDQALAGLVELLPPLWWQLYKGCQKQGFSDVEAMSLVKTYILSQEGTDYGS